MIFLCADVGIYVYVLCCKRKTAGKGKKVCMHLHASVYVCGVGVCKHASVCVFCDLQQMILIMQ